MVRKNILPKRKSNSKRSSSNARSTSRSIPASTSVIGTPTRQMAKRSQITKVKGIEKRQKKKHSMPMRVGSKIFQISAKIIKEIKYYQTSTHNLIPKLPFARLVQEIMSSYIPEGRRIQRIALEAMQEAAESYLVQYFEDSYVCSLHARRSTLIPRDMEVVERLRGNI